MQKRTELCDVVIFFLTFLSSCSLEAAAAVYSLLETTAKCFVKGVCNWACQHDQEEEGLNHVVDSHQVYLPEKCLK